MNPSESTCVVPTPSLDDVASLRRCTRQLPRHAA
jgi:hypothetical protein